MWVFVWRARATLATPAPQRFKSDDADRMGEWAAQYGPPARWVTADVVYGSGDMTNYN